MNIKTLLIPGWFAAAGLVLAANAYGQTGSDEPFDLYLNASENQPCDMTGKVENASCTGSTGWNRHRRDAAAGYNKHNADFDSDTYSGVGIESWYWTPEQGCELIWQEVAGLLPGRYKVTAYAVGQVYNDAKRKGKNVGTIYLFAGNGRTPVTSSRWEEVEVECDVAAGSTLRIGIAAGLDNANDWVSIAQVRVACIGAGEPEKIALNEAYDIPAMRAETYADIYLSKYIPDTCFTWLCVPFNIDEDQLTTWFEETKAVTAAECDGTSVSLALEDAAEIRAGQVYLVKAAQKDHTLMIVERAHVVPTSAKPVDLGSGITLVGTYRRTEDIEGAYLLTEDGQTLTRADKQAKAKGFSAYLTVEGTEARELRVNLPGKAVSTSAAPIEAASETEEVNVYTPSGICLRKGVRRQVALERFPKGIYIIHNQKVAKP